MIAIGKIKSCLPTVLVMSASICLAAETSSPESYFHKGATRYIDKKMEAAKASVAKGLKQYPNDAKLQALEKLLEQQQQKEQQQKEQEKEQKQNKKDEDKQKQNQKQQQDKQQQQKQPQEQEAQQEKRQPKPEEMTKEEARMLLDAMKQEEKAKREKMRIRRGEPQPVEKNW